MQVTSLEPEAFGIVEGRLPVVYYERKERLGLQNAYYQPTSKTEPTLDFFIYDSGSNTITLFQITVSETHALNVAGLT